MPQGWSAEALAQVTRGRWTAAPISPEWRCEGVCAESSRFRRQQMLLATNGSRGLRHHVLERLMPDAAGIIVQAGHALAHWRCPVIEVPDMPEAVGALATDCRNRFEGRVIAVTGSVGKTSTVAMAAHALGAISPSDCSRTSANSPYGIGWNFASMDLRADFWVQEVAATHMQTCSALVRPHVAIVTAIAPAHVARFGSTEEIARQKALIYTGMAPGGVAVTNADMPEFPIFESAARAAQLRIVRFGSSAGCDVRLIDMKGSSVRAEVFGDAIEFELGAAGWHMAMNATAVLAAVAAMGLPVPATARQLASFEALPGRGRRVRAVHGSRRIEVWDESYNANPASMHAALRVMEDAGPASVPYRARLLVLGDMLELGVDAQAMHLDLEADVRALNPDRVLLCGALMRALSDRLHGDIEGQWFEDIEALLPALDKWVKDGDVVLVKSSNGTGLAQAVRRLQQPTAMGAA